MSQRDALASLAHLAPPASRLQRDEPGGTSPRAPSALRARVGQIVPAESLAAPSYAGAGIILAIAGAAIGGYHGYERNRSLPWTLVWSAAGFLFPVTTTAVAIGQGYASKL